jgi:hypothetical protein
LKSHAGEEMENQVLNYLCQAHKTDSSKFQGVLPTCQRIIKKCSRSFYNRTNMPLIPCAALSLSILLATVLLLLSGGSKFFLNSPVTLYIFLCLSTPMGSSYIWAMNVLKSPSNTRMQWQQVQFCSLT